MCNTAECCSIFKGMAYQCNQCAKLANIYGQQNPINAETVFCGGHLEGALPAISVCPDIVYLLKPFFSTLPRNRKRQADLTKVSWS